MKIPLYVACVFLSVWAAWRVIDIAGWQFWLANSGLAFGAGVCKKLAQLSKT